MCLLPEETWQCSRVGWERAWPSKLGTVSVHLSDVSLNCTHECMCARLHVFVCVSLC